VKKNSIYLAHSANAHGTGQAEPLREHLALVARRAAGYAAPFGAEREAELAGLLHDIGKYSERFLRRLDGTEHGLDHWTPGAIIARKDSGFAGTAVAAAVLGHHIGLQHVGVSFKEELLTLFRSPPDTFTEKDVGLLVRRLTEDGLALPKAVEGSIYDPHSPGVAAMLDVRMLFSTLVDADFIETEAHFDGDVEERRRYRPEGPPLRPEDALESVRAHVARLSEDTRSHLINACRVGSGA